MSNICPSIQRSGNLNVTACQFVEGRTPKLFNDIYSDLPESDLCIPKLVYDLHCCRTQNIEVSSQKNLHCP